MGRQGWSSWSAVSSMPDKTRLQKELKDILMGAEESGVSAEVVDDDLSHWKGTLKGPEGTPYEGGEFIVDIRLDADYPYNPPKMKFDTRLWHPNVSSQTGAICLDILKGEWSPALTIRTALLSLQVLLSTPEPDSPQDAEVATMYRTNLSAFNKRAEEWTKNFAIEMNSEEKEKLVSQLISMGFEKEKSILYLTKYGWDPTKASNAIL